MNPLPVLVLTALWLFSRRKMKNLSTTTSGTETPGTDDPQNRSYRGFDVFINFRGPDSRHTIADVLYDSLTHAGFRVFLDDEEIRKGEVIEGELLRAITNSRIYIPIFSKDYASSKWCLRELTKMIDCWESSNGDPKKVILPIFYDVDVSKDVKLRSKVYTTALQNHKDELGEVAVKPWTDALCKVARIKGWNLKDHGLCELADLIKEEVFSKLTPPEAVPSLSDRLVGIDKPIEDIMVLLEKGSPGLRFIVIHGMGGIGKTTLADAVFKRISSRFQGGCFLRDVRRSVSVDDMVKLQEKLLSDTLNLNFIKVSDTDDGIDKISKRLREKKVLIVLDDVDKRDHLLNLVTKSYWFGPRSRIIITTRNTQFLPIKDNKEYYFYEVGQMDAHHALQLFCRHAFEKDRPPPEFSDISTKIVDTTGGLPLSLQVIGSSLYNQDDVTWRFRLEKLKEAPHKDVQETLMISYQALEYEQQQIFLDIACFFNDEKMIDPIYYWEACKFYPDSGIKILVRRSMIKVYSEGKLWMHDQLRDLGRAISQAKMRCLESQSPARPSRLWSPEVALDVVRKQEVDESIISLNLGALDEDFCFVREQFARAVNLKFLQLQGGNFEGDFKNVLQQLMWLSWSDCRRLEEANLCCKNLVVLKLSRCQMAEDWGGWGVFTESKHLKVLHLEHCCGLTRIPSFSTLMQLERLILRDCFNLVEIDISINKLKHLNYLEICNVQLRQLHPSIGELVHLKHLRLRDCLWIENLPGSIGKLVLLEELEIHHLGIEELPDSIGDLIHLKILRIEVCRVKYLPDTIGRLQSLEELSLMNSEIISLPETIGNLERLKVINVSLTNIGMLPKALIKLENLEILEASCCWQMDGNLPEEIGKLSRLRILDLSSTPISRVPTTMNQLSHLQELDLHVIHEPQELSNLPVGLVKLHVNYSSLASHQVPDLSNMTNLVKLSLRNGGIFDDSHSTLSPCNQTPQMEWLAKLTKLEDLTLDLPDPILLPTDLSSLSHLESLDINCSNLRSLPYLPSGLNKLHLVDVKSPMDWLHLSSLNNLFTLHLSGCCLKEIKVDCFEHLHELFLRDCEFLERISNLSCLKELQKLHITGCPHLVDIEGVEELKSLRSLELDNCASAQMLDDLSSLTEVEEMSFWNWISREITLNGDEEESHSEGSSISG